MSIQYDNHLVMVLGIMILGTKAKRY